MTEFTLQGFKKYCEMSHAQRYSTDNVFVSRKSRLIRLPSTQHPEDGMRIVVHINTEKKQLALHYINKSHSDYRSASVVGKSNGLGRKINAVKLLANNNVAQHKYNYKLLEHQVTPLFLLNYRTKDEK